MPNVLTRYREIVAALKIERAFGLDRARMQICEKCRAKLCIGKKCEWCLRGEFNAVLNGLKGDDVK